MRTALAAVQDGPELLGETRQAAVAVVLRPSPLGPSVLLMTRAKRDNDPWSGQVSLPGGRREIFDDSLRATAMREAHEELDIALAHHAQLLGPLPTLPATGRGMILPMTITPYVFVENPGAPLLPQPSVEAANFFWLPLAPALAGELNATYEYPYATPPLQLPCWRCNGNVVWGLTYRVLGSFFEEIGATPRPFSQS